MHAHARNQLAYAPINVDKPSAAIARLMARKMENAFRLENPGWFVREHIHATNGVCCHSEYRVKVASHCCHCRKVVINPNLAKVFLKHHYRTISVQGTRSMSPPNASGSQKISKRDGCALWPLGNCSSAKDSSETFSGMDAARSLCSVGSFSS